MIVRILSNGKSFKGLSDYLIHDPNADTDERVAFTHTHNLANDHVPSAVNEMLWTAREAELLKQEAGIRAGGRATENTVKHVSLNWSPDEQPTREHMIATGEDFLRHMNWQEHQAVFVAHQDKAHSHIHLMVNAVHPETGMKLDDNFERRRAQAWALEYEREHGMIYCDQRLMRPDEREASMTREAWMAFQEKEAQFQCDEENRRNLSAGQISEIPETPENARNVEWQILKDLQKEERLGFFAEGKSAFAEIRQSVYREVREEFRERWSGYYAASREGGDAEALAAQKAALLQEQKELLGTRRDAACEALRTSRDADYRGLLDGQRDLRHAFTARQEAGLDNGIFLQLVDRKAIDADLGLTFREAATETGSREEAAPPPAQAEERASTEESRSISRPAADMPAMPGSASAPALPNSSVASWSSSSTVRPHRMSRIATPSRQRPRKLASGPSANASKRPNATGARGREPGSGTRQGTGPAATASPASAATSKNDPVAKPPFPPRPVEPDGKVKENQAGSPILAATSDDTGEEAEISATFRRMLSGSRGRRRDERIAALRAARNWLSQARKALRERREAMASLRRMQRRWQAPGPS